MGSRRWRELFRVLSYDWSYIQYKSILTYVSYRSQMRDTIDGLTLIDTYHTYIHFALIVLVKVMRMGSNHPAKGYLRHWQTQLPHHRRNANPTDPKDDDVFQQTRSYFDDIE